MTNTALDFDAEKRRRWYAAVMGSVSAATIILIIAIREKRIEAEMLSEALFIWLSLFAFIGIAAYTLWYRPYARSFRAIIISIIALFLGLFSMFGVNFLIDGFRSGIGNPVYLFHDVIELTIYLFGIPHILAGIIGWFFARQAPDVGACL